eukprot:m.121052 g.121052  ORF g.121052 m.121052 type:complete len:1040 (+) comp14379_c0_seq2:244-3363(+)
MLIAQGPTGIGLLGHLRLLAKYHEWAFSVLLSSLHDHVNDEVYYGHTSGGMSVHTALCHFYHFIRTWYCRLTQESDDTLPYYLTDTASHNAASANPNPTRSQRPLGSPTRLDLVEKIKDQWLHLCNMLENFTEMDLNATFEYYTPTNTHSPADPHHATPTKVQTNSTTPPNGAPTTAFRGSTVSHILSEASYHRGQLAAVLQQLGAPLPTTDLMSFLPAEDTISFDRRIQPFLNIAEIEGKLNISCQQDVNNISSPTAVLILQGPSMAVREGKRQISAHTAALSKEYIEATLDTRTRVRSSLALPTQTDLETICAQITGVAVQLTESSRVNLRGMRSSVAAAESAIMAFIERNNSNLCTQRLDNDVTPDLLRQVFGDQSGQYLQHIKTLIGPSLELMDDDDGVLMLSGKSLDEVERAMSLLRQKINEGSSSKAAAHTNGNHERDEIILEVHAPEQFHRFLIGARGATMKQIQTESEALLFFPNTKNAPAHVKPSGGNIVTVVGTKEACYRAERLIAARIEDCHKDTGGTRESAYSRLLHVMREQRQIKAFTGEVQVKVASELHGFVVGGRGFVLKEIQAESGARVYLPTTKTAPARARAVGKDVITIIGSEQACAIAMQLVLARAEDAENGRRSKEDSAYMSLLQQIRDGQFKVDMSQSELQFAADRHGSTGHDSTGRLSSAGSQASEMNGANSDVTRYCDECGEATDHLEPDPDNPDFSYCDACWALWRSQHGEEVLEGVEEEQWDAYNTGNQATGQQRDPTFAENGGEENKDSQGNGNGDPKSTPLDALTNRSKEETPPEHQQRIHNATDNTVGLNVANEMLPSTQDEEAENAKPMQSTTSLPSARPNSVPTPSSVPAGPNPVHSVSLSEAPSPAPNPWNSHLDGHLDFSLGTNSVFQLTDNFTSNTWGSSLNHASVVEPAPWMSSSSTDRDELGAAGAWSSIPQQNIGNADNNGNDAVNWMHVVPDNTTPKQEMEARLFSAILEDGTDAVLAERVMQLLIRMPEEGLRNCLSDRDLMARMVHRCKEEIAANESSNV